MFAGSAINRLSSSSLLHLLFIVIAGTAVYSNTLNVPFHLDDIPLIRENPIIRDPGHILHPGSAAGFKEFGYHMRRLVGSATFVLNYSIHGLDLPGYHIFNIALHVANALLLYLFVTITLATPLMRGTVLNARSRTLAFVVSLIFVVHPVHTEAITYIYQRVTALSFTFYVSSLCFYGMARSGPFDKRRAAHYLLSVLCAVAAAKTKENSLTLPLAVALYELVFFPGPPRRRAALLVPFLLPVLVYAHGLGQSGLSAKAVLVGQDTDVADVVSRSSFDTSFIDPSSKRFPYAVTEQRVMVTYLRLLVLPVRQNLIYDYPYYNSMLDPPVLFSMIFHLLFLALGAWCILASRRQGGRGALGAVGFGVWFFYTALVLESTLIPLPSPIFEYRLYLPSAGFLISVVTGVSLGYERLRHERKAVLAFSAAAVLVLVLSVATYQRNRVWETKISLWSDVVSKSPRKVLGHSALANGYFEAGDYASAVSIYEFLLKDGESPGVKARLKDIRRNLSVSYIQLGLYDKAIEVLGKAIAEDPESAVLHSHLGGAYKRMGMWKEAVTAYERSLEFNPRLYVAHIELAEAYRVVNEPDRAMEQYRRALQIRPGDHAANNNMASMLLRAGRPDEALPYISTALEAWPEDVNTRMLLEFYYKLKESQGPDTSEVPEN